MGNQPMNPLHEHLVAQLAERIKKRQVVVWYDPERLFTSFVAALCGNSSLPGVPAVVSVAGIRTHLIEHTDSMFEVRELAEPFVKGDTADPLLIYLPGCQRVDTTSVLMELEQAGEVYESSLKKLAGPLLRKRFTDAAAAELLGRSGINYDDIARVLTDASSPELPPVLKGLFADAGEDAGLLAIWLMSDSRDAAIESKEARGELIRLIGSQLGLAVPEDTSLPKLRTITLRYVLVSELRGDLDWTSPACLDGVPVPRADKDSDAVRKLSSRLRGAFAREYAEVASRLEEELGLRDAKLPGSALRRAETFPFQERLVLRHCEELMIGCKLAEAIELLDKHVHSFWLERDLGRRAHWEVCRKMAELASVAASVHAAVKGFTGDADAWIAAYASLKDGWYRMDRAHRHLETWVSSNLYEEPDERALGIVRRAYEDTCDAMARGFSQAFVRGGWMAQDTQHHTQVFSDVVASRPKPVAYLLVDALRFEMGVELRDRLPGASEVVLRPAVAALPTITPVGMAALQPGAATSFDVVDVDGKLGARIDGTFLPDVGGR
jgi:hypothetical protein